MDEVLFMSIREIRQLLRSGQISNEELLSLTLRRIERLDGLLNAFITTRNSRVTDSDRSSGGGRLEGIPIAVKDLITTREFPTSAGSRVFEDGIVSSTDALLVRRLKRAGAVIVGKTSLHEFAYGVTNENAHYGPVRNPWDLDRVSGGSSGGSAAAVVAGMSFASIGTDTRGSIRIPSSFCGVTGLKPTYGSIPLKGVLPLSPTLDHAGPITRTVDDAALLFDILSRSKKRTLPEEDTGRLRLGLVDQYLENLDPEMKDVLVRAVQTLEDLGLRIDPVSVPRLREAHEASRVISSAEALVYHDRFIHTRPASYDPKVLKRLKGGSVYAATDFVRALRARESLRRELNSIFRSFDCLLGASVPCLPPRIGEDFLEIGGRREEIVENLVRMNAPQNIAGVPAMVVPCGFTRKGCPVGLQMIAARYRERTLFRLGRLFQRNTDWHRRQPVLPVPAGQTGSGTDRSQA